MSAGAGPPHQLLVNLGLADVTIAQTQNESETGAAHDLQIAIAGEMDLSNIRQIEQVVGVHCDSDPCAVTIDLQHTVYIDSVGLSLLVRIARRLRTARTPLTVLAPAGSYASRVIAVSGLSGELGASREPD